MGFRFIFTDVADALKKLVLASDQFAFPVIIVDAKAGAIQFHEKFGFISFAHQANKLIITVADVRFNLGQPPTSGGTE